MPRMRCLYKQPNLFKLLKRNEIGNMKKINTVQELINELMLVDDKNAEINIIQNVGGYETVFSPDLFDFSVIDYTDVHPDDGEKENRVVLEMRNSIESKLQRLSKKQLIDILTVVYMSNTSHKIADAVSSIDTTIVDTIDGAQRVNDSFNPLQSILKKGE